MSYAGEQRAIEMGVYDDLPEGIRRVVIRCDLDISAISLRSALRRGADEVELINYILDMQWDLEMGL